MFKQDLSSIQIDQELEREEDISFIASLYGVPIWCIKQKIRQGISLYEMEQCYDLGAEL